MSETAAIDSSKLEKRLARSKEKIKILEEMIEDKTRNLYLAQETLRAKSEFLTGVLASMQAAVIVTDQQGIVSAIHGATEDMTASPASRLIGQPLGEVLHLPTELASLPLEELAGTTGQAELVGDDVVVPVLFNAAALSEVEGNDALVIVASDVGDLRRLEVELRHAQKLESVGQLAAGVAHEINTPVQFIGDSVNFLAEAMTDSLQMITAYRELRKAAEGTALADQVATLVELEEELDIEFVEEEAPRSIERTKEGVRRVAEIVAAMKQFSHPGGGALAPLDLDSVVETTLVVAKSEYKYVAAVECRLGAPPEIMADRGDIGQVVLNLIVNAAHAIADHADDGSLGKILVQTRTVDGGAEISITDTGGGVPATIRDRIFDPFFTTKEPGRGTGQGLAIAHNIVVERHGGRLDLEVDEGIGSTFRIFLPAA